jgi:hypothetical protein
MSEKAIRRLLWVVALVTVPVPFYLGQAELAPTLRLAFFTALLGSVVAAEGGGLLAALAGVGMLQTAIWATVLWFATRLPLVAVRRAPTPALRSAAAAAVVVALAVASLFPIYDTGLSSTRDRSSILQLFQ